MKLDTLSLSGSVTRRGPGEASGRARAGAGAPAPPSSLLPAPLARRAPGSLLPTLTSDDAASGREDRRTALARWPPEVEEVVEARAVLSAAWASVRAVCIVENAVEIGTPGAWKQPFTKVPIAWSTTLSGGKEKGGQRARKRNINNRSCDTGGGSLPGATTTTKI